MSQTYLVAWARDSEASKSSSHKAQNSDVHVIAEDLDSHQRHSGQTSHFLDPSRCPPGAAQHPNKAGYQLFLACLPTGFAAKGIAETLQAARCLSWH